MRIVCLRRRSGDLGAALLRAPFVDMVSTALDPQAPLVAHEASEWGDAAGDAAAFDAVSPALLPGMHAPDQGKALPPASPQLHCCHLDGRDSTAYAHVKFKLRASASLPHSLQESRLQDPDFYISATTSIDPFSQENTSSLPQMAAICPYHSLLQQPAPQTPPVLVSVAADDGRVPAWGPAKWVAALAAARQRQAAGSATKADAVAPAVLLPRRAGGHFGNERDHFAERATEYAFLVSACERQ